jgi:hypothetical protein
MVLYSHISAANHYYYFYFISYFIVSIVIASDYELAIVQQLFTNYNSAVRPAKNSNAATVVQLSIASNGGTAFQLIKIVSNFNKLLPKSFHLNNSIYF